MNNRNLSNKVRVIHRYLGFFLAGIMFVYALSGITLTFRDKDYFKKPIFVEKTIEKGLKNLPNIKGSSNVEYNSETGDLSYTQMQPPKILGALEKMHKATSSTPLYFLNVFLVSLYFSLFFLPIGCFSHRQMFLKRPFIIQLPGLF